MWQTFSGGLCLAGMKNEANQVHCKRRRPGRNLAWAVLLLIACYFLFEPLAEAQAKEVRRILVFNELGLGSPGIAAVHQELLSSSATGDGSPHQ